MAKILIVDDDKNNRQLFVCLLTPFGHQVMEAGDGKEGLEQAQLKKPDLIISDILMPTMNGYEFVSALRKCPTLGKVPIIFHSATFLDRETRSLGATCGVSLFISKPCEPEKALAIVQEALGLEIQRPTATAPTQTKEDAIPLLINAFYEKGKQLDHVSMRLACLLELGLDLAHSDGLDRLMDKAGNAARKIVGANYSAIGILAGDGLHLRAFALFGVDLEVTAKFVHPVFDGPIFKEIVSERKARRAFSPFGQPAGVELPVYHPPVRNFLGVPLEVGNRVYGWIYVADKIAALEFTDEDSHILAALAAQSALAFENADRFRTIEEHTRQLETEIEERKRAEDRFHALVETAPTAIVIADEKGRIVEMNAQALSMFGYARGELIGKTVETLLPERFRHSHQGHRTGYMKKPHARPMGVGMELLASRKDGTEFPVEISLGPLVTREGVLVSSTIVDITARKQMEQQFRLSQRMEAIGKLAGGVAHDFNNLLTVILGSTDVLLETHPPEHSARRKLELIRQAGCSAADLTRQLLAFSRQQMLQPRVLELKEIVNRTKDLLARLIGDDISLTVSVEPSLGCICADPGQIEQVLLNLAVNARDAMPKGGRLSIEARNTDLDESYKQEHQQVIPGQYVMIAVQDSGCGMDRKTQARIFDPFFTTKELGKGTGLGLATVYGIVKQSGGYIWVYSEVGRGTAFKVYLPRVEPSGQTLAPKESDKSSVHGSETILLAEDSDSLREMARDYLESIGYTVIEATSGKDALQRARDFEGPIHLLLTDVVMAEMCGSELAEQLLALRPGVKVIFTSGYTNDAIAHQGVLEPGVVFIQKPYRPKALAQKIREVLTEPSTNASNPTPSGLRTPINT
ncbi:MAG TPA: response regulator [Candidatus Acidoferrum sp.]|nr:response regulator [Candidatus Acidoferrum sp.]